MIIGEMLHIPSLLWNGHKILDNLNKKDSWGHISPSKNMSFSFKIPNITSASIDLLNLDFLRKLKVKALSDALSSDLIVSKYKIKYQKNKLIKSKVISCRIHKKIFIFNLVLPYNYWKIRPRGIKLYDQWSRVD